MMRARWMLGIAILAGAALRAGGEAPAAGYPYARETAQPTALDRYVAKPDPNYRWELVRTDPGDGITSYTIDLTSQQWRTAAEVNRPIWKHWLTVSVPDSVAHATALLYIDGGNNNPDAKPRGADGHFEAIAKATQSITATVYMVPNQPLVFADAMGWGRSEDAMIAYTWDKFYRTGDEEWPARLPMTKAVVRAMDTLQAFCAAPDRGAHALTDFVVAGGSKRGWTTWTTAIVDTRVRAIVPCVIDALDVIPSFRHHYAVYGAWTVAIGDYKALRILDWLDTPENEALMDIVDPYRYRARLTMPKLVLNAGNDQFFTPDSSRFYWDGLEGPKRLRYVPNAGHGLDDSAYTSVQAFYQAILTGAPIPDYHFSFDEDGAISVQIDPAANGETILPDAVTLWQAHNPKSRDFRGSTAQYLASPLEAVSPGRYRAAVPAPETGWTAFLIELRFPGPAPETPFVFTSGVRITPDATPATYTPPAVPPKGFLSRK